jgi:dihydroxy-acid dehydratase
MVMGTASTMALCAEALGMMLPNSAAIPAVMAERVRNAEASGARAVAIAFASFEIDEHGTALVFGAVLLFMGRS